MRNTVKYRDIHIGDYGFTAKLTKEEDDLFGESIRVDIYELHPHPHNFFQRIVEFWRYKYYNYYYYTNLLTAQLSLDEAILRWCGDEVDKMEAQNAVAAEWATI